MNSALIEISHTENGIPMVSSKEVARKFGRRHDNFLKLYREAISHAQGDAFIALNFEEKRINTLQGTSQLSEVMMTRDGFSILAFGLTGREAFKWKVKFLNAFDALEKSVHEYRDRIATLEFEKAQLEAKKQIEAPKKPHHLKDTVLVPVPIDTLFGLEIEWKRAPKTDHRFSDLSRMEGEMHRLMNCVDGMQRKLKKLSEQVCIERRR